MTLKNDMKIFDVPLLCLVVDLSDLPSIFKKLLIVTFQNDKTTTKKLKVFNQIMSEIYSLIESCLHSFTHRNVTVIQTPKCSTEKYKKFPTKISYPIST